MAGSLKSLKNQLDVIASRSQAIENDIKKLDSAKKDKDKKTATDSLLKQVSQSIPVVQKLEDRLKKCKKELENNQNDEETTKDKTRKNEKSAEESELESELKAQLMRNVEVHNEKLKVELALQEKIRELKYIKQENERLQDDCKHSQSQAVKFVQNFEKKAKEASAKLISMQEELKKSQELTNRYRDLYDTERQKYRTQPYGKPGGASGSKENVKSANSGKESFRHKDDRSVESRSSSEDPPNSQSMLAHGVSVNDIIRKNQSLSREKKSLEQEIKDLRKENQDLMKRAKETFSDRDSLLHQLNSSEKAKQEISKQLQKEKAQKQQLEKSLTKQASDWIQRRKQVQQYEDEYRWSLVNQDSKDQKSESPYKSLQ
ncbi:hypothetical protein LOTGIDRAFT_228704 [Lottia gigantea]|uniref:Uncharacterized protein n=1 Tax=Lottia gigantea TaxID=225164 RepID=V4A359_LOTGI|nr:hypothetical protein LOTGIDRAFT_228704 [Lottia gigantea]ESO91152.1 hypothetical protein LOTGIDRAFT_228704 [Lottia gigantea]